MLGLLFARRAAYTIFISVAILFSGSLRTIFTAPVEYGGDALKKWLFVKDLLDGLPLANILIDHHTARWGVNIPSTIVAAVFGTSWFVYYLVPIVFFVILLGVSAYNFRFASEYNFRFFSEKSRINTVFVFSIFLLLLYGDPTYVRSTSQLMPFIFVAVYISFHILFLWRITQNASQLNIFLAAFFMFLAYGSKETSLFYAPGSCLFLIFAIGWRRGAVVAGNIALYGLLLLAIETLVFSLIFSEFTTRLSLLGNHFRGLDKVLDKDFGKVTFATLFTGWVTLPVYTSALFVGALASTVFFLFKWWRDGRVVLESLPGLLFLSYGIIHTFALKSIDPLIPFVPPLSKYFADLVPWAAMLVAFAACEIVTRATVARRQALAYSFITFSFLACVVSLSIARQWRNDYPTTGAWMWHSDETYAFVSAAVKSGVPIKTAPSAERMLEKLIGVELTPAGNRIFVASKLFEAEGDAIATVKGCIVVESGLALIGCAPKPGAKTTRTSGN